MSIDAQRVEDLDRQIRAKLDEKNELCARFGHRASQLIKHDDAKQAFHMKGAAMRRNIEQILKHLGNQEEAAREMTDTFRELDMDADVMS